VLGAWGAPQSKKGKGKAKAGSGGAGGGPSTKAAAAAGSSGEGSSSQGSSRPSAPSARIGLSTEEPAVQLAEAASGSQQTEPQPAGGGNTKADKERQRKERQRQRKIEEACEALDGAMARMAEARAGSVEAVKEAMQAAAKHGDRSESLTALVAEAKGMLEQARAAEAERAKAAAEAAAAAAAVEAAERLRLEEEMAALTLSVQREMLRLQQVQAQLGVPPAAPAPQAEEELCVMCFDAPKDHIIIPCGHQCVCGACAEKLKRVRNPACPICREPINATFKVFVV
jgi:hypothetical protein